MDNIVVTEAGSLGVAKIVVIGVGGGGNNAINRMISSNITNVDFIAVNTDQQDLEKNLAPVKFALNSKRKANNNAGLGAGGKPEVAKELAEECSDEIEQLIDGANMVFITAGMGGGTGTGAAPVIAKLAKSKGILTVAVVTKPFNFEGKMRIERAKQGIENLKENVDTLLVIPNNKLRDIALATTKERTPFRMSDAFLKADEVLMQSISGVTNIIRNTDAVINLDFADVETVMRNKGYGHVGIGVGEKEDKVKKAIEMAISSPLLETSVIGAKSMIFNITADPETDFMEVEEAMENLTSQLGDNLEFFYGFVIDDTYENKAVVTIIATDLVFDEETRPQTENKPAAKKQEEPVMPTFVEPTYSTNKSQPVANEPKKEEELQQESEPQKRSYFSDSKKFVLPDFLSKK